MPEPDSALLKLIVVDFYIDVEFCRRECYFLDTAFRIWLKAKQCLELGRWIQPPTPENEGSLRKKCYPELGAKSCAGAREVEEVQCGGVAPVTTA